MRYENKFQEFLDRAGMSITQFSELIGESRQVVYNWAKGIARPHKMMRPKIASFLTEKLGEFIGPDDIWPIDKNN